MEVGSAEVQPARGSQLGVTDYRMGGRFQTDHPTCFPAMVIQNSLMPKKTSLPKARILLIVKWICPIHAEPIHGNVLPICGYVQVSLNKFPIPEIE